MKRKYIFMVMMALVANRAGAQEVSLAGKVFEHTSLRDGMNASVFQNPAMQSFHYRHSLNTLNVGYDYRHASTPKRWEEGDGHSQAFADVDAYLHKGKATLWGNAYYVNGRTRNVLYNETTDFEQLYPYLMADTVGGKTSQEYYHFMGGFSYPLGKKWTIGAEGEYTARMEYRTRDPRPKNLTGDLRAKVGVSYLLSGLHSIGAAVTARKYKQTNELKLYNEVSVPTIYHLTGLGNDYYRFRGVNTSTYYKGYGVGGMLTYSQKDQKGWFAQAEYEYTNIDKIISTLNELPMATLESNRLHATVGYLMNDEHQYYGANLNGEVYRKFGTENIFGTAQDNIYPQIASAGLYSSAQDRIGIEAFYQSVLSNKSSWGGKWKLGYMTCSEKYQEPYRRLKHTAVVTSLLLDGKVKLGKCLLMGNVHGGYEWAIKKNNDDSFLSEDKSAMMQPIVHTNEYLAHDHWNVGADVEVPLLFARQFLPFIKLSWQYDHYLQTAHQNALVVSAGIRF